jgi:hypothetical protein
LSPRPRRQPCGKGIACSAPVVKMQKLAIAPSNVHFKIFYSAHNVLPRIGCILTLFHDHWAVITSSFHTFKCFNIDELFIPGNIWPYPKHIKGRRFVTICSSHILATWTTFQTLVKFIILERKCFLRYCK